MPRDPAIPRSVPMDTYPKVSFSHPSRKYSSDSVHQRKGGGGWRLGCDVGWYWFARLVADDY